MKQTSAHRPLRRGDLFGAECSFCRWSTLVPGLRLTGLPDRSTDQVGKMRPNISKMCLLDSLRRFFDFLSRFCSSVGEVQTGAWQTGVWPERRHLAQKVPFRGTFCSSSVAVRWGGIGRDRPRTSPDRPWIGARFPREDFPPVCEPPFRYSQFCAVQRSGWPRPGVVTVRAVPGFRFWWFLCGGLFLVFQ